MGAFFDSIQPELEALPDFGIDFGFGSEIAHLKSQTATADYETDATTVKAVQTKLNTVAKAGLATDGAMGPKTRLAVNTYESVHGLPLTGGIDEALLKSLGVAIPANQTKQASGKGVVKVSTVIAALRQAAKEKNYTLPDPLVAMMIGQLRGSEGAMPGIHSSLGGTNNYGAAQVSKTFAAASKGKKGFLAFAHKDSDPDKGPYLGWYSGFDSPLSGAREWFGGNWWGPALAKGQPQTPTEYAGILYRQGYFGGMTPHGADGNNPDSPSGQKNVAAYAAGISRGMATAAELADKPDDPAAVTVDPTQFATLDKRAITQDLYDKAKGGGLGSAWGYLLPPTWDAFQKANGVVWFGPPPGVSKLWWYVGGGGLLVTITTGIVMSRRRRVERAA